MPPGVKSGQPWTQSRLHIIISYPILQWWRWDKDQISDYDRETGDVRVPVGRGFTNEIENNVFDEEIKTDVDAELDKPEQD